jgi:alpha-ketoglutarate-dependent taurine dioxygenase
VTTALGVSVATGKPPVVCAVHDGDPLGWLDDQRADLDEVVERFGAVLIRGFDVSGADLAAAVSRRLIGEVMTEREGFAPRGPVRPGLYTSTVWPEDQPMCMHHELSYAREMPSRMVFCCLVAPEEGGATALADAAAVLRGLPPELVGRFAADGWQLVRSHNDIVGMPWTEAFGTDDRTAVERYCRAEGIDWDWDAAGGLRTRRRRPAVVRHPRGGAELWCNQIAFLNEWTMDPAVREYLVMEFGVDGLPFTTLYGDGTPLDRSTVDLINDVYAQNTVWEPWRSGDVLLVDNLRMAHSRTPYRGERRILVAMGDPWRF